MAVRVKKPQEGDKVWDERRIGQVVQTKEGPIDLQPNGKIEAVLRSDGDRSYKVVFFDPLVNPKSRVFYGFDEFRTQSPKGIWCFFKMDEVDDADDD